MKFGMKLLMCFPTSYQCETKCSVTYGSLLLRLSLVALCMYSYTS